jgi:hypothetical protein
LTCNRDFKDCGEKEETCRKPLFDTVSLNLIADSKTLLGRPSSRSKHLLLDLQLESSFNRRNHSCTCTKEIDRKGNALKNYAVDVKRP